VGGDWERKGIGTLIEAVAGMSANVRLIVLGSGDVAAYERRARDVGCASRVAFVSPTSAVESIYAAADIYVTPTRYEPFGLTPLEAMASGVPTVVSRSAGVSSWLTHGVDSWLLDDPVDAVAIRADLNRLVSDPGLRLRLSKSGRRTAEEFRWDRVALSYEQCYRALVTTEGAGPKRAQRRLTGGRDG
jgi:UDP-glucose:(heptosyl)LPS alpha-1,3-glucosyltransferase